MTTVTTPPEQSMSAMTAVKLRLDSVLTEDDGSTEVTLVTEDTEPEPSLSAVRPPTVVKFQTVCLPSTIPSTLVSSDSTKNSSAEPGLMVVEPLASAQSLPLHSEDLDGSAGLERSRTAIH